MTPSVTESSQLHVDFMHVHLNFCLKFILYLIFYNVLSYTKTNFIIIRILASLFTFSYEAPSSVAAFFLVTAFFLLDAASVLFPEVFAVIVFAVLPVNNITTGNINRELKLVILIKKKQNVKSLQFLLPLQQITVKHELTKFKIAL